MRVMVMLMSLLPLTAGCIDDKPITEAEQKRASNDVDATTEAELAVRKRLKAPSSADLEPVIVDRRGGFVLVRVQTDAQNSFGAKLRSYFCVVYEYNAKGERLWDEENFVSECKTETDIARAKRRNGWPKK